MKREKLLRGKRVDNGQWVEGSLIGEDVIVGNIVDFEEDYFTTEFWYRVDPETVGQFTGMTDKNGTKIFEGDIYTIGDDNIRYVVVWRKCMFIGKQIGSNSYAGLDYFESEIKKVGNIHDNPELLKQIDMKVLSIEQMNKLKELGVDVNPKGMCLMYTSDSSDNYYLKYGESTCEDDVAAFSLQDIIEMLPKEIDGTYLSLEFDYCIIDYYYIDYEERISWKSIDFNIEEIIGGVYEMLIWVIENGYLKTK